MSTTMTAFTRAQYGWMPRPPLMLSSAHDAAFVRRTLENHRGRTVWLIGETWTPEDLAHLSDELVVRTGGGHPEQAYAMLGDGTTVRQGALWCGETGSVPDCERAWKRVTEALAFIFDPRAGLLETPAMTGMDLLRRSLPFGATYEPLAPELVAWFRDVMPQGRIEQFAIPDGEVINYDMRWAYAACVRNLPTGPVEHVTAWRGNAPGWYHARVTIPRDWDHIGLLGLAGIYPSEPGKELEWIWHGAELALAMREGWAVTIREGYVWPAPLADPCQTWITKLRLLRRDFEAQGATLEAAMIRRMVLHTVGLWARGQSAVDYAAPRALAPHVPANAFDRRVDGDLVRYRLEAPLSHPETFQPHWAGTVWARCRARLAKAALQMDPRQLVALRTDGIWSTQVSAPIVSDRLDPGMWRVKPINQELLEVLRHGH